MYSDERDWCSHQSGFPIRKSPDHRLLASSRGLSQLTTSFIASLRQGIHTHALSSLTIKSISNTKCSMFILAHRFPPDVKTQRPSGSCNTCSKYCPSNIRLSKIRLLRTAVEDVESQRSVSGTLTFNFFVIQEPLPLVAAQKLVWWAWIDSNYRPHPYQGCALAT